MWSGILSIVRRQWTMCVVGAVLIRLAVETGFGVVPVNLPLSGDTAAYGIVQM